MLCKSSSRSLVAKIPSAKPWSTDMSELMLKSYSWSKVESSGFIKNSLARTSFTFASLRSDLIISDGRVDL